MGVVGVRRAVARLDGERIGRSDLEEVPRLQRHHRGGRQIRGEHVKPAASDVILDRVFAREVLEPVDPEHSRNLPGRVQEAPGHPLDAEPGAQLRSIDEEAAALEVDRGTIPASGPNRRANRGQHRLQIHPQLAVELRDHAGTVVRRERDHDPGRVAQGEQGVEQPAQDPIQPQDLIVLFLRFRPPEMAYVVGGRERDGEDVGGGAPAQVQVADALEGQGRGELVDHRGEPEQQRRPGGVGGKPVGKGDRLPVGFHRDAVALAVGPVAQHRAPFTAGIAPGRLAGVEPGNPVGQRCGVPRAGGEDAVVGVPVDLLLRPSDRQDRASVFGGDRERPGPRIRRDQPIGQRSSPKPERGGAGIARPDERRVGVAHAGQVPRDPGAAGKTTGHGARVTRRGLGDGVVVVRVGEVGAAPGQPNEPPLELGREAVEVVGTELVHCDED